MQLGIQATNSDTPALTCGIGVHPCGQKIETRVLTCWAGVALPHAGSGSDAERHSRFLDV